MSEKKRYNDAPKFVVPYDDPKLLESIQTLRERLEEASKESEDQFYEEDVLTLMKSDFNVRRFLFQSNMNIDESYKMMIDQLNWRKKIKINEMKPSTFPRELFQAGGIMSYKVDVDGDPVLYVRSALNMKMDEIKAILKQFLVYNIEIVDKISLKERSWGLVFDAQGFGWYNIDFEFLTFIIKIMKYYYCWSAKYIAIYEIPWFLASVWKAAQSMFPEDAKRVLRVYNKKTISEIISEENLPEFMKGETKISPVQTIPENLKTIREMQDELKISNEKCEAFLKYMAPFLPSNNNE